MKEKFIISFKITVAVIVAILAAKILNLKFYNTVTTIIIVSMLSPKKQSIKLSGTLLLAAIYSLSLATLLFSLFGFSLGVFAIYIFIFILTMYLFDTTSAIIANVVLIMQIYSLKTISFSILLNQFTLMFLGLLIALIFNYFTIDIESELIEYRDKVENIFKVILFKMGKCLNNECSENILEKEFKELNRILLKAKNRSYVYLNSFYIEKNNYYIEYFTMRMQQFNTLVPMREFTKLNFLNQEEVKLLRKFTDEFANNFGITDSYKQEMNRLEEIEYHFTDVAKIPDTKKQLQNRIALHRYLYGLLNLVEFEMQFTKKLRN